MHSAARATSYWDGPCRYGSVARCLKGSTSCPKGLSTREGLGLFLWERSIPNSRFASFTPPDTPNMHKYVHCIVLLDKLEHTLEGTKCVWTSMVFDEVLEELKILTGEKILLTPMLPSSSASRHSGVVAHSRGNGDVKIRKRLFLKTWREASLDLFIYGRPELGGNPTSGGALKRWRKALLSR